MATHSHDFLGDAHDSNARRTRWVVWLSATMMVAEIVAGTLTGSMALSADGWHMATHTLALGVSALAYSFARRNNGDQRYSWGTGKVGSLAGFASALGLAAVALGILYESGLRLVEPRSVAFGEALVVAVIGLLVNLASAALLGHGHSHDGDHGHDHAHDHNLRSAYLHVLADALTSVLAIAALAAGWWFGIGWLDAAVGVVGALVILHWSRGLVIETAGVLLDRVPDQHLCDELRAKIEGPGDVTVHDWHLWAVGPGRYAAIVSATGATPSEVRRRLGDDKRIAHLTVECS
ncbi:CDF family Co(II)/Ni(II) efflux transporter DmeF [Sphingomonas glaciei]|uniref:CDF family Co(II)/Ni(II) efflux transporter DmeF n=1 Tax=Sphingomonas glaciei TaxID=2938948 RepID=A0ABY5MSY0_9SPHN|nr:CDF family Co(II)/Ni(II) efflux transporter DmeF [Sphingomonas glaciei]UUR07049.1 CDF family Co(II)/Ni(II) efflux transporter DmeF [Sphingomonas glaciei]